MTNSHHPRQRKPSFAKFLFPKSKSGTTSTEARPLPRSHTNLTRAPTVRDHQPDNLSPKEEVPHSQDVREESPFIESNPDTSGNPRRRSNASIDPMDSGTGLDDAPLPPPPVHPHSPKQQHHQGRHNAIDANPNTAAYNHLQALPNAHAPTIHGKDFAGEGSSAPAGPQRVASHSTPQTELINNPHGHDEHDDGDDGEDLAPAPLPTSPFARPQTRRESKAAAALAAATEVQKRKLSAASASEDLSNNLEANNDNHHPSPNTTTAAAAEDASKKKPSPLKKPSTLARRATTAARKASVTLATPFINERRGSSSAFQRTTTADPSARQQARQARRASQWAAREARTLECDADDWEWHNRNCGCAAFEPRTGGGCEFARGRRVGFDVSSGGGGGGGVGMY